MNDDDLLQALGELARERASDAVNRPDVWSRLARGELSARELSELEARAAGDAPLALSLRAYRPLSDEARERIVDALGASLPQRRGDAAPPPGPGASAAPSPAGPLAAAAPSPAGPLAAAAPSPAGPRATAPTPAGPLAATPTPSAPVSKVVSLGAKRDAMRRRLVRVASPLAAMLTAAAALWALVLRPAGRPEFAALPSYELVARGGLKQTRGAGDPADAGPLRLSVGSELDLTLRPATRVEGPLGLRAFVLQGGEVRPWPAPVEIAPTGALRVHGPADQLLAGLKGPVELRLVVGRVEALGDGDDARQKALSIAGVGPGWQTLNYKVELVGAP